MEKIEAYKRVLKTLKTNHVMVEGRKDGVYIRPAMQETDGGVFSAEWVRFYRTEERSNTFNFAANELNILAKTVPDAIITPFRDEILALCEAFGKSGQSGGSAPYTATAISKAVKKLMLQEPICPVTGIDEEWVDVTEMSGGTFLYQNKRCSGLFKYGDGKCSYVDAIVWKGVEDWDTFTGRVYVDNEKFELIGSSQYVRFPFKPKTFYIDVIRIPITKEDAVKGGSMGLHYIEDGAGECYYSVLKDPKQLEKVWEYYDKK